MGGSQGAVGLNRMVRAAVPDLLAQGCRVVHLTGRNDPDIGQLQHGLLVERPFSDDIPGLLQHADLAISRAGAGSLSELAVCGTPTVLVPFPQAADQHQEANAACAAELGGAVIVHQHTAESPVLGDTIQRLLGHRLGAVQADPSLLGAMREGMAQLADARCRPAAAGAAAAAAAFRPSRIPSAWRLMPQHPAQAPHDPAVVAARLQTDPQPVGPQPLERAAVAQKNPMALLQGFPYRHQG